jgi:DNA-binding IclR family transcriptional regulator
MEEREIDDIVSHMSEPIEVDSFKAALAEIREKGYSISEREHIPVFVCMRHRYSNMVKKWLVP